jgi:ketosteroid isomerase-like protein
VDAHSNHVIVRDLWDAIARGDSAAIRALLSEKPVWQMPGSSAVAGSYVGADAVLHFLARIGELTDDLQADLLDSFVSERGAVLHYRIHAVRGSERLDTEHLFLVRIEAGRIFEATFAPFDQQRYDRFFTLP